MSTTTTGFNRRDLFKIVGAAAIGATVAATAGPGAWSPARAAERIVPRAKWGFDGWVNGAPAGFDPSRITRFIVHYHGSTITTENGVAVPRLVHKVGKGGDDNGSGIRYSFVITQDGTIYEGRGFTHTSAATRGVNEESVAVQLHIAGSTKPSTKALASLEWLYGHTHQVVEAAKALRLTGHNDHGETDCPGGPLGSWVDGRGQELYAAKAKELGGGSDPKAFPGADAFKIGKSHPAVKTLDEALIAKKYTKHHDGNGYQAGTTFSEYTRKNVQDFQKAQGWSGADADGYPGKETWKRLVG